MTNYDHGFTENDLSRIPKIYVSVKDCQGRMLNEKMISSSSNVNFDNITIVI